MKAIILEKTGGVDNFVIRNVDKPAPKENEVLIEVKAISINPVDYKVRQIEDVLTMICQASCPLVLGWDIAGTVSAVGSKVTQFALGDKVFGMVNFPGVGNAYAEYVAAPADHLAKMPANISFEEAAAATLAALTALQVLEGKVKKGDRVLIHAGSGGVGHYAIQIAKHYGAHVLTTCSARNKDFVMSLGADEHIDYRTQAFEEVAKDIDFVLDSMSGETLTKSLKVMKSGGTIISLPGPDFPEGVAEEAKERNIDISFMLVASSGEGMNKLSELLGSGAIKSHVSKTFPFIDLDDAHQAVESGRTVGKVVVTV